MKIDPLHCKAIRDALVKVTEEIAVALRRSGYSTNIKARSDFACDFLDRQLQLGGDASTQPVDLGALSLLVP